MKVNHKLLLGAGAVAAVLFVLHRRRKAGPSGVILTSLTVARDKDGCGCFSVQNLSDGTVRSTRVARAQCEADVNLAAELAQCSDGALDGVDTRPSGLSTLAPKTESDTPATDIAARIRDFFSLG